MEKFQDKLMARSHGRRPPRYNRHRSVPADVNTELLLAYEAAKHTNTSIPAVPIHLTPSQRLRIRRKQLNLQLESSLRHTGDLQPPKSRDLESFSDDDDQLPDDLIVFNVPLSKSLKLLSSKEQFIMNQPVVENYSPQFFYAQQGPRILNSSVNGSNRSSLFSYNSSVSNLTDDNLSLDLKFFTIELNRSIDMIQLEESQQRISNLKDHGGHRRDSTYSSSSQATDPNSAFLSGTRPSNLPPKDKFESLKHSRDFKSIINRAIRDENEKCQNQLKTMKITEIQRSKDRSTWNHLLKNLNENLSKPSTRELWWRGIPSELRPRIWCQQIGNKLQLERVQVAQLLRKAGISDPKLVEKVQLHCFPNLSLCKNENLIRVISLYLNFYNISIEKLEIGLFSLAATLLYNIVDPTSTFIALCNILHRKLCYSLINNINEEYLQSQLASFDRIFNRKLNRLSTNFKIYNISSIDFLKPLCSYCLTNYLDLTKLSTLIDIYLFEGDSFLLRCALGFLSKISYKLFGNKEEVMKILGPSSLIDLNQHLFSQNQFELIQGFKYLDLGSDDEFFQCIRSILRD